MVTSANGEIVVAGEWTALPAQKCRRVHVANLTGVVIEFRQDGAGVPFPISAGLGFTARGIADASQLQFRRKDLSVTGVTLNYRFEA